MDIRMKKKLKIINKELNVLSFVSLQKENPTEKITAATTGNIPSKKEENPGIFLEFK